MQQSPRKGETRPAETVGAAHGEGDRSRRASPDPQATVTGGADADDEEDEASSKASPKKKKKLDTEMQLLVKQFEQTQLKAQKLERHRSKTFAFADERQHEKQRLGGDGPAAQLGNTMGSHAGLWASALDTTTTRPTKFASREDEIKHLKTKMEQQKQE